MKKFVIMFFACAFFITLVNAQSSQKWDYPIKPGSTEWAKFEDNASMVKACQIPKTVLDTISTENLFYLVLDYPLIYDIFAFPNVENGIEKFINDFNGARELFNRESVFNVVFKRIQH
ncbi:MAG: hypothetical protein PHX50_08180 [Massilibacteroides sp.]|nr:hypothetical protein [Massilibacteroides sp.]MDD4659385.1 hypothetical protein [Massilibacteroides sp.]